jgi:hypothetical protein
MVGDRFLLLVLSLVTLPLLIVSGGGCEVHEKSKGISTGTAAAEGTSGPSSGPPVKLQSLNNSVGYSKMPFEAIEVTSSNDGGKPPAGPEMELRLDIEAADRLPVRLL